jgi:hypothetical protein
MNIFWVNDDPVRAAMDLCDKHIPKMALETAQMLCAAYPDGVAPYRRAYYNHPCTKWARQTQANYDWLVEHGYGLCYEFIRRYRKQHACRDIISWCEDHSDLLLLDQELGLTAPAQAMPDWYKSDDPVEAYRNYYLNDKRYFAKWERLGRVPTWWKEEETINE